MTLTKSSQTGTAPGTPQTPQPKIIRRTPGGAVSAAIRSPPTFMEEADAGMLDQFAEKFRLTGIDAGPEDTHEIKVLEQFLGRHVQANRICEVQCMLLWSEWIRTFQRRTPGFPKLIREKEFRTIITDNFGIQVTDTVSRGAIYPGIKFVP